MRLGGYEVTYQALLDKIIHGPVIHADETRAKILGRQGYVWVLANSEEVVFTFTENREASTPQRILEGFDGVLVSDFLRRLRINRLYPTKVPYSSNARHKRGYLQAAIQ